MTINITRWSPDTCGCVLEYSWDDSVSQNSRTHTFTNYIKRCAAHSGLADDNTRFATLLDENPRKNNSLQSAIDTAAAQLSQSGAAGGNLKLGINYNFSFSGIAPNRVLNISFTGITLTTAQKNTIQNALTTKFGAGKVVIS